MVQLSWAIYGTVVLGRLWFWVLSPWSWAIHGSGSSMVLLSWAIYSPESSMVLLIWAIYGPESSMVLLSWAIYDLESSLHGPGPSMDLSPPWPCCPEPSMILGPPWSSCPGPSMVLAPLWSCCPGPYMVLSLGPSMVLGHLWFWVLHGPVALYGLVVLCCLGSLINLGPLQPWVRTSVDLNCC